MEPDRRCPKCGQVIPWGESECPLCSERHGYLWSLRRDTFLLVVCVLLMLLFVVTGFAVRSYHAREESLARDWNRRGEEELKAGLAEAALMDFRSALYHSRGNAL